MRVHHETLNRRPKTWGWILSQVFCNHITMHGNVFRACAVVMQLTIAIANSEPLFRVEYED